jgi:hypothetical protein
LTGCSDSPFSTIRQAAAAGKFDHLVGAQRKCWWDV